MLLGYQLWLLSAPCSKHGLAFIWGVPCFSSWTPPNGIKPNQTIPRNEGWVWSRWMFPKQIFGLILSRTSCLSSGSELRTRASLGCAAWWWEVTDVYSCIWLLVFYSASVPLHWLGPGGGAEAAGSNPHHPYLPQSLLLCSVLREAWGVGWRWPVGQDR